MAMKDILRIYVSTLGVGLSAIQVYIASYDLILVLPAITSIIIYLLGYSFEVVDEALFISGLIILYPLLIGYYSYIIGVVAIFFSLINIRFKLYGDSIGIYIIMGATFFMSLYLYRLGEIIGFSSLYRFFLMVWGGAVVISWVYISTAHKHVSYFKLGFINKFIGIFSRRLYNLGLYLMNTLFFFISIVGDVLPAIFLSLIGYVFIYRRVYMPFSIAMIFIVNTLLYMMLGSVNIFSNLDELIRSLGGIYA